jgi:hypothetical protein
MRRILLALSVVLLSVASACGDDPVSVQTAVGTYALASIKGDPVPSQVVDNGQTFTVTSGSFVLTADQKFTWSEAITGLGSVTVHGTWSLSGSAITFTPTDAEENTPETGTLSGNTLSITFDATEGVRIYNKQ